MHKSLGTCVLSGPREANLRIRNACIHCHENQKKLQLFKPLTCWSWFVTPGSTILMAYSKVLRLGAGGGRKDLLVSEDAH